MTLHPPPHLTNSLNTLTDQPPVYITSDGTPHRSLTSCYDHLTPYTLKPLLILTYEEYLPLINTPTLTTLIKELS